MARGGNCARNLMELVCDWMPAYTRHTSGLCVPCEVYWECGCPYVEQVAADYTRDHSHCEMPRCWVCGGPNWEPLANNLHEWYCYNDFADDVVLTVKELFNEIGRMDVYHMYK